MWGVSSKTLDPMQTVSKKCKAEKCDKAINIILIF